MPPGRRRRAESRARYYIREIAARRGWNTAHVNSGGDFLEENEILHHFPRIGLENEKPDFLICLSGEPACIVEAKNNPSLLSTAMEEATDYADTIITSGRHFPRIAIGAAGNEDSGFLVEVRYRSGSDWIPLSSHGNPLTTIPSPRETELAVAAADGTTEVAIPDASEFIDAAIELSSLLRTARVEAPLRPKVIGALVTAMYQGDVDTNADHALSSINFLCQQAINNAHDLADATKQRLIDAIRLSGADFDRLSPSIARIVAILRRLNIRVVLNTDADFLGMFYEAFLRYGYDNNALGIVFTPRHITRFCVELTEPNVTSSVIDIASGTGGFLVAAYDRMMKAARSQESVARIKESLHGFDTNPTVWALSMLNMFFRGDGKSNIFLGSCLDHENKLRLARHFSHAFLNPPFSQENEPEYLFIDTALNCLRPEGVLAAVVYAGIFADHEHRVWRKGILRQHTLLGMISLPEDLFYPTAAPTSIVIIKAHVPHGEQSVMMARIWNDGFEKLKNRRVSRSGSQLSEIDTAFRNFLETGAQSSGLTCVVNGSLLHDGQEWSPQEWLPQPETDDTYITQHQSLVMRSVYQAVANFPELAIECLDDFTACWTDKPELPYGSSQTLDYFFEVRNGRSTGEKNYREGTIPYISSGDATNSIISLKDDDSAEIFETGGITVTAFGTAALQPWPFLARGNGGSSVRVLLPKYRMTISHLVWFAAQINMQRWRFFMHAWLLDQEYSDSASQRHPLILTDLIMTFLSGLSNLRI